MYRHRRRVPQRAQRLLPYPIKRSEVSWKPGPKTDDEKMPKDAYKAGIIETGEEAYIAKGSLSYQIVTGMNVEGQGIALIPYGCREHRLTEYEILSVPDPNTVYWSQSQQGNVPQYAVTGGSDNGETQFIGRTCTPLPGAQAYGGAILEIRNYKGGCRIGKIHPSHNCLYIPYGGQEFRFSEYEVLCHKITPDKLTDICRWYVCKFFKSNNLTVEHMENLPLPPALKNYLITMWNEILI